MIANTDDDYKQFSKSGQDRMVTLRSELLRLSFMPSND